MSKNVEIFQTEKENFLLNERNIHNGEAFQNSIINPEEEPPEENIDFNVVEQINYNNPRREPNINGNNKNLNFGSTTSVTKTQSLNSETS